MSYAGLGALGTVKMEATAKLDRITAAIDEIRTRSPHDAAPLAARAAPLVLTVLRLPAGASVPPGVMSEIDRLSRQVWMGGYILNGSATRKQALVLGAGTAAVTTAVAAWWWRRSKRRAA